MASAHAVLLRSEVPSQHRIQTDYMCLVRYLVIVYYMDSIITVLNTVASLVLLSNVCCSPRVPQSICLLVYSSSVIV